MSHKNDEEKVLRHLKQGGVSNNRLLERTELSEERYTGAKRRLLEAGLVEKMAGRGGGLRLTRKGAREANKLSSVGTSSVDRERELYEPLIGCLQEDDDGDGAPLTVGDSSSLLVRGKWSNPDVTMVQVKEYPNLFRKEIYITTFEVKQWDRWGVSAAFEAASQARFSHESYLVLEWAKEVRFNLEDSIYRIDQVVAACNRFGVGLATMTPHRSSWKFEIHVDAIPRNPNPYEADLFLETFFERYPEEKKRIAEYMAGK